MIGGDVDGDGFSDLAIGSHTFERATAGESEGAVWLYRGGRGGVAETADAIRHNPAGEAHGNFGARIAMGDVNGDGRMDLLVGARGQNGGQGGVLFYEGVASGGVGEDPRTTYGDPDLEDGAQFGVWVAASGDLNGDGIDDLIAGAELGGATRGGIAYCFLGGPGLLSLEVSTRLEAPTREAEAYYGARFALAPLRRALAQPGTLAQAVLRIAGLASPLKWDRAT